MTSPSRAVLSVIVRRYALEFEDEIEQSVARLQKAVVKQPGFVDLQNSRTEGADDNELITVFTFDSQANLDLWNHCPVRRGFAAELDRHSSNTATYARFDDLALLQNPKAHLRKIEIVAILIFWIVLLGAGLGLLTDAILPVAIVPFWRNLMLVTVNVLLISYIFLPWSSMGVAKLKGWISAMTGKRGDR